MPTKSQGRVKPNVSFWPDLRRTFPTNTGTYLEIQNEDEVLAELRLDFAFKGNPKSDETDIVKASLLIPDNKGVVWSLDSFFTPEIFITHMFDASSITMMGLQRPKSVHAKIKSAFKNSPLLSDAHVLCDDRFYRLLLIEDQLFQLQFKYTMITFDAVLFFEEENEGDLMPDLILRIRKNSLWGGPYRPQNRRNADKYDEDADEDFDDLGELYFFMQWQHLFKHNTAAFDREEKEWVNETFPRPLSAQKTIFKGKPQEFVSEISKDRS